MTKKERNIRRAIFFGAILAIMLLICGSMRPKQYVTVNYYIEQGDTLWKIAGENKPEHMSYQDYIYTVFKLNDGLTADIYPGQAILVPVYEER